MHRGEDVLRQALLREAGKTSAPDDVVFRILGETSPRGRTRAKRWPVLALCTVVALSVWLSVQVLPPDPPAVPSPARQKSGGVAISRGSLPAGYVDLHVKNVHVGLDQRGAAALDPWRSWQVPCHVSVLAPPMSRPAGKNACAGSREDFPLWEVRVFPSRHPQLPLPRNFKESTPTSRTVAAVALPLSEGAVDRRQAVITAIGGTVRYPCTAVHWVHPSRTVRTARLPCPGRGWQPRRWTGIYFPDQQVQASFLAPDEAGIAWLTSSIYVT